jgi:hypothetical protein
VIVLCYDTNHIISFRVSDIHDFVVKVIPDLVTQLIEDFVHFGPVDAGIIPIFLAIGFVEWEELLSPVIGAVGTNDNATVLLTEGFANTPDRIEDHVAKIIRIHFTRIVNFFFTSVTIEVSFGIGFALL